MNIARFFRSCVLLLFISLGFLSHSEASHINGFSFSYRCVGGLDYEVTLYLYEDCKSSLPPSATVTVCVNSTSCSQYVWVILDPIDTVFVPTICNVSTKCTGGIVPGIEGFVYMDTITLPMACNDWIFSYQRAIRNPDINTATSIASDLAGFCLLDNVAASCNSSPVFNELPFGVVCVNKQFVYDFSATDIDGDSIVYKLDTPYSDGACGITKYKMVYKAGLGPYNPASTSGPFLFNDSTGVMSFTATIDTEVTVMSIIAEEYRNGNLIGNTMQWVQFYVLDCATFGPQASFSNSNSGLTISFTDNSIAGDSLFWDFGDSNTDTSKNPIHTYASQGNYNVCLIVNNDCGADTICMNIFACSTKSVFIATDTVICENDTITFTNSSIGATNYVWQEDGITFSTSTNATRAFNQPGNFNIELVANGSTCNDTSSLIVQVKEHATVDFTSDTVCFGDTTSFTDLTTPGDVPIASWNWDFGDSNTSTFQNPQHLYLSDTVFMVGLTITDSSGCISDTTLSAIVYKSTGVDFSYTINGLEVSFIDGSKNAVNWFWEFGDLYTSTLQNTVNAYATYATYTVCLTVISSDGCVDSICKTLVLISSIEEYSALGVVTLYPNPNDGKFQLHFSIPQLNTKLIVKDVFGRTLQEIVVSGDRVMVDLGVHRKGIFFLSILDDNTMRVEKIVVR